MTDINNAVQTVSQTEENALTRDDSTGKGAYVSPTLVRIGSTAHDTKGGINPGDDGAGTFTAS